MSRKTQKESSTNTIVAGKNRPDKLVTGKIMDLMYLVAHPPISTC